MNDRTDKRPRRRRRLRLASLLAACGITAAVVPALPATATLTTTFSGTVDANGVLGPSFKVNKFAVQSIGTIHAALTWSGTASMGMMLKDPTGAVAAATKFTTVQPITLDFDAASLGNWNLGVKSKSGAASYSVTIMHSPSTTPPAPSALQYSAQFGYTGHAGLYGYGMAFDATDNSLLVGDLWNYRVQRYDSAGHVVGTVSHVAARGALGGIGSPFGLASDPDGNVWVADQSNSRVVEFDHNGNWIQTIGSGGGPNPGESYGVGCGNGMTVIPTHLVIDPTNRDVYVSDPRCRNVYVFDQHGAYLRQFTFDMSVVGLKMAPIPRGVVMDAAGNVYVAEFNSKRIFKFDKSGNQLSVFPTAPHPTDMSDVRGIAIDQTNNVIYAVGAENNKVVKWSTGGTWLASWGESTDRAFDSIRFVTTDGAGNVYVSDVYGYRVWKLDPNGNVLPWASGSQAPPNGGFNQNNGIAIDPATGNLYVVDTFGNDVQRFATTNPDGSTSSCTAVLNCPAYQMQFGHRGPLAVGSPNLDYPHEITFADGSVWMEAPNAVLQFDPDGNLIQRWGTHGKNPGQFSNGPQGMKVIPTSHGVGTVYTTDVGSCRLQTFDFSGNLLQALGSCGANPTNQMAGPRQIDVRNGFAYVADTGNSRIDVWDLTAGTIVRTIRGPFGSPAKYLSQPRGVVLDPSGTWLYIADSLNRRIVRVHPDGTGGTVVSTGADTPATSLGGPEYLEFGPDGRLFVSDNNQAVYAFTVVA